MARTKRDRASKFGDTLARLMKEHNVSVTAASKIANVSTSVLVGWKAGKIPQDFTAVQSLANHFGITTAFLLTGINDRRYNAPDISEIFSDGGLVYDGYLKVRVERIVRPEPRVGDDDEET